MARNLTLTEDKAFINGTGVKELQEYIEASKGQKLNVDSFLALVRRNLEITELTPEIIRTFVEKI